MALVVGKICVGESASYARRPGTPLILGSARYAWITDLPHTGWGPCDTPAHADRQGRSGRQAEPSDRPLGGRRAAAGLHGHGLRSDIAPIPGSGPERPLGPPQWAAIVDDPAR